MASSDIVGVIGVTFVLLAYYLLNINKLASVSLIYLSLNGIGASFILFSLFFHWNLSAALIEFAWILISLLGFYRVLKK